ncbi:MAG: transglycosylase SLT domain-containing protein [Opitutales bacterium]
MAHAVAGAAKLAYGSGVIFEIPLNRKTAALGLSALVGLVLLFWFSRQSERYIPPDRVLAKAHREAKRHDLDPHFIFALAVAESTLNAHATSSVARGMMQLTRPTWEETTHRPYIQAFDWGVNMAVAAEHLADLRSRLADQGRFTYPRLAAAYRYGLGALARNDYDVSRFGEPPNLIYRELFRGQIPSPRDYGASAG